MPISRCFRMNRQPRLRPAMFILCLFAVWNPRVHARHDFPTASAQHSQIVRHIETPTFAATVAAKQDTGQLLAPAEIEEEYAVARHALRSRDWVKALVALEMISASHPDYREVNNMIVAARRGLEQDSTEALIGRHYVEGLKAKRVGDHQGARQAFRAVLALQRDFRDAAAQLAELEAAFGKNPQNAASPAAIIEIPLDSLFAAARAAAKKGAWQQAVVLFSQLEELDPENQELRKQAEHARINFMIAQTGLARVEAASNKRRLLKLTLAAAAILAALAVLAFGFSSRGRAQYFIMRRKYRRAEQVYESMLQRAPSRLSAYPLLAHLYLRTGRTDSAALKVFRVVLDLNLRTAQREKIAAVAAMNAQSRGKDNEPAIVMLDFVVQEEHKPEAEKKQTQ